METEATSRKTLKVPERLPLARGRILLVGTGAYNVTLFPSWGQLLTRHYGCEVRFCLTYSAARLVAPEALAAVAKAPVWGPEWPTAEGGVPHQVVAAWPDLVVVAPATANFLGKCANGITDSLALSAVAATAAPVVVAPSVAEHQARKPSTERNLALLAEDGYHVVPFRMGRSLHTGETSLGAMADLAAILNAAEKALLGEEASGT